MQRTKLPIYMTSCVVACGITALAWAQTPQPAPQGKSLAASAGLFAYPAKGQKPDQQTKDEAECYNWSKTQSGYDPMSPPPAAAPTQATQPQATEADGSRVKGAARGAAAGAVIGEVADNDAGKGAAIGATAGALAGGRRSRMAQSQNQQQAAQQSQASAAQASAARQELANAFKLGMSVCLEARDYTVK
jgi:hypothetical protein